MKHKHVCMFVPVYILYIGKILLEVFSPTASELIMIFTFLKNCKKTQTRMYHMEIIFPPNNVLLKPILVCSYGSFTLTAT